MSKTKEVLAEVLASEWFLFPILTILLILSLYGLFSPFSSNPEEIASARARAKQVAEQTWTVKRIEVQPKEDWSPWLLLGGELHWWTHFVFVGDNGDRILIKIRNDDPDMESFGKLLDGDVVTFVFRDVKPPRYPDPVTFLKLEK